MTSKSKSPLHHHHHHLLLSLLLFATITNTTKAIKILQPSVILEQKKDAPQVLLVRTTSNGTTSAIIKTSCGTDTFYVTPAVVLGVNRTAQPDAKALGAEISGEVMTHCNALLFKTYERKWKIAEDECRDTIDPGRIMENTCGYVYLTPGMEVSDPYSFAVTGKMGFEEVDGSVCELAAREHCPEYVMDIAYYESIDGDGRGGGSDGSGFGTTSNGGEGESSNKNGAGILFLGCNSVLISLLFAVGAS